MRLLTTKGFDGSVKRVAFFSNPFGNVVAANATPPMIGKAFVIPVPSVRSGWIKAILTFAGCAVGSLMATTFSPPKTKAGMPGDTEEHFAGTQ